VATSNPIDLAAEIVTSFISNNSVPRGDLPALIEAVHAAVKRLAEPGEVAAAVIDPPAPPVSIRKSVTPDYLICLEDGKRFKSLRRHLTALGMTAEQYRAKWSLPSTYPMIAPNYRAERSALAKNIGLGLREKPVAAPPAPTGTIEVIAADPASAETIEAVASEPVRAATIDAVAAEPASVAKSKRKSKRVALEPASVAETRSKAVAAPPKSAGKRKAARRREATA
jgi:predicted transcriptional regulator